LSESEAEHIRMREPILIENPFYKPSAGKRHCEKASQSLYRQRYPQRRVQEEEEEELV